MLKPVKISDLWIGDKLRILSSGKVGTYEGKSRSNKIRVRYQEKILLVKHDNIEYVDDSDIESTLDDKEIIKPEATSTKSTAYSFSKEIDLHMEKLNPGLQNAHPQLILDHQLVMCRAFIADAIAKKRVVVTVIHGKGTGALKEEVLHMLKEFSEVRFAIEVNGGGAQEVWFRY